MSGARNGPKKSKLSKQDGGNEGELQNTAQAGLLQNRIGLLEQTSKVFNDFVEDLLSKDILEQTVAEKLGRHWHSLKTAAEEEESKGLSDENRGFLSEFGASLRAVPDAVNQKMMKLRLDLSEAEKKLLEANDKYELRTGKLMNKFFDEFGQQESISKFMQRLIGKRTFGDEPIEDLKNLLVQGATLMENITSKSKNIYQILPLESKADSKQDNFEDSTKGLLERLDNIAKKSAYCESLVQRMHQTSSKALEPLAVGDDCAQTMFDQIYANLKAPEDQDPLEFVQFLKSWEESMVLNFKPSAKHAPLELYVAIKRTSESFEKLIEKQINDLGFEEANKAALEVVEELIKEESTQPAQTPAEAQESPQPQQEPEQDDESLPEQELRSEEFQQAYCSLKSKASRNKVLESKEYKTAKDLMTKLQDLETKLEIFKRNAESSLLIVLEDCRTFFGEEAQNWPDAKQYGYTPTVLMDNIYLRRITELEDAKEKDLAELEALHSKIQEQTAVIEAEKELALINSVRQKKLEEEERRLQNVASSLEKQLEAVKISESRSRQEAKELLDKYSNQVQSYHTLSQELAEKTRVTEEAQQKLDRFREDLEARHFSKLADLNKIETLQAQKQRELDKRTLELQAHEAKLQGAHPADRFAKRRSISRSPSPIAATDRSILDKTIELDFAQNKKELQRMRSELETLRKQMKREQTEVSDNRPQQRKQEDEDKLQKKTKEELRYNELFEKYTALKESQSATAAPNMLSIVSVLVAIICLGTGWFMGSRSR